MGVELSICERDQKRKSMVLHCQQCNNEGKQNGPFANRFDIYEHRKQVHDKYTCTLCPEICNGRKGLWRHRKTTGHQSTYKCDQCETQYSEKDYLIAHQRDPASKLCGINCEYDQCSYRGIDYIDMEHHRFITHKYFDQEQFTFKEIISSSPAPSLCKSYYQKLMELGVLQMQLDGEFTVLSYSQSEETRHLIMFQKQEIVQALSYTYNIQRYQRHCLLCVQSENETEYSWMGILVDQLLKILPLQRITEIFILCPPKHAQFFKLMQFFYIENPEIQSKMTKLYPAVEGSMLMSRKTSIVIKDFIPRAVMPQGFPYSAQGNQVRNQILLLRTLGFDQCLIDQIKQTREAGGPRNNKYALLSDQAQTPDKVFNIVETRYLLARNKLHDSCPYSKKWKHDTHYDALLGAWHGDFGYCNPPYSIGFRFNAKALYEFIYCDRNVIMLIPQLTTNSKYGYKFFRLLGNVHNIGSIRFKDYSNNLILPVSLVYLIQPNYIDFIVDWRSRNGKMKKEGLFQRPQEIMKCQYLLAEKLEVAKRLISLGATIHEARHISEVAMEKVSNLGRGALRDFQDQQEQTFLAQAQLNTQAVGGKY